MPKEIEINVKVNNRGAKVGFDQIGDAVKKLNPELSKMAITTEGKLSPALQNVSRRDLGIFASQLLITGGVTGRFTNQLSNLATGLATGGVIGAAFAGFAALVQLIGDNTKTTILELNDFQRAVESMINIQTGKGAFNIKAEDIPKAIETLRSNIKQTMELSQSMTVEEIAKRQELNAEIIETNFAMYQSIEVLERQKKSYDALAKGKDILIKAGLVWTDIINKETDVTKKLTEEIKKQADAYKEMLQRIEALRSAYLGQRVTHRASQTRYGGLSDRASRETQGMVNIPEKPVVNLGDLEQMRQDMIQFSQAASSVFAMNMSQAWQSIFGEANSMFEQMLMAWQSMLFEKIGFGIFNMLFGGIDLFGFARNLTAGSATATKYRMGG